MLKFILMNIVRRFTAQIEKRELDLGQWRKMKNSALEEVLNSCSKPTRSKKSLILTIARLHVSIAPTIAVLVPILITVSDVILTKFFTVYILTLSAMAIKTVMMEKTRSFCPTIVLTDCPDPS